MRRKFATKKNKVGTGYKARVSKQGGFCQEMEILKALKPIQPECKHRCDASTFGESKTLPVAIPSGVIRSSWPAKVSLQNSQSQGGATPTGPELSEGEGE